MAARFPQSASSVGYQIKAAYASKIAAIYWAATADSVHRLLPGETASTIITRSTTGAGFNAADGRITGTNNTVFSDFTGSGLGDEAAALTYIGAYYGDIFNGAGVVWWIGAAAPQDIFNSRMAIKNNGGYVTSTTRPGASVGDAAYSGGDDVLSWMVLGLRYDPDDPTAHYRTWSNGTETGINSNSSPTSPITVGTSTNPMRFGGTLAGTGNTRMEGECWIVGLALTDADMAAITADPSVVIEVASGDTTDPVITGPGGATGSTSSVSIAEGTTAVHTFSADESVTWDLNGGADVALFSINSSTGALAFSSAPDYESPADADTNNVYVVGVRATDAATNATTQTVSVTVTDAAENAAPSWSGTPSAMSSKRGQAYTPQDITSLVSDADLDTLAYTITGAPTGVTIHSSTGIISGTPTAAPGVYSCTVEADDGIAAPVASSSFNITVVQAELALDSAGYEFGDGSDPATMAVVASTELQVAVYPLTEWPPASAIATATDTTGTNGRLADLGDDDLSYGTTYRVVARNAADGETWAWTMAAS